MTVPPARSREFLRRPVGHRVGQLMDVRVAVPREPDSNWVGVTVLGAGPDRDPVDVDLDRMAASVTLPDGSPRFVWTDVRPDHDTYVKIILDSISERQRWRSQYEHAKTTAVAVDGAAVEVSTVAQPP
jgi:hypothetical protein